MSIILIAWAVASGSLVLALFLDEFYSGNKPCKWHWRDPYTWLFIWACATVLLGLFGLSSIL